MPTRYVWEKACRSDDLAAVSAEAERLFWRLMTQADDFGRFDARPAIVRAGCFPLMLESVSATDVAGCLNELGAVGLVAFYGEGFGLFPSWERHQRRRAGRSKFPDPSGRDLSSAVDSSRALVDKSRASDDSSTSPSLDSRALATTRGHSTTDTPDVRGSMFAIRGSISDATEPTENGTGNARRRTAVASERSILKDALVEATGRDPKAMTRGNWGQIEDAAKQLSELDPVPDRDDILACARDLEAMYGPSTVTPHGIVNNFADWAAGKLVRPKGRR